MPQRCPARTHAFARMGDAHGRRYRDLTRFLVCVVFYQAGMQAVIALAAIYAEQAMGFSTQHTIALILVVNVTAASAPCASATCRTGSGTCARSRSR